MLHSAAVFFANSISFARAARNPGHSVHTSPQYAIIFSSFFSFICASSFSQSIRPDAADSTNHTFVWFVRQEESARRKHDLLEQRSQE